MRAHAWPEPHAAVIGAQAAFFWAPSPPVFLQRVLLWPPSRTDRPPASLSGFSPPKREYFGVERLNGDACRRSRPAGIGHFRNLYESHDWQMTFYEFYWKDVTVAVVDEGLHCTWGISQTQTSHLFMRTSSLKTKQAWGKDLSLDKGEQTQTSWECCSTTSQTGVSNLVCLFTL